MLWLLLQRTCLLRLHWVGVVARREGQVQRRLLLRLRLMLLRRLLLLLPRQKVVGRTV